MRERASACGGFVAIRSVGTAARIKIWFPQMMGVDVPAPGRRVFHLMFCLSFHTVGGLARGAKPLASGPRQWCH